MKCNEIPSLVNGSDVRIFLRKNYKPYNEEI